jgi:hypothetical protein
MKRRSMRSGDASPILVDALFQRLAGEGKICTGMLASLETKARSSLPQLGQ